MDRRMYINIMDKHPHMKYYMTEVLGSTTYAVIYRAKDGRLFEADLYNPDPFELPSDPAKMTEAEQRLLFGHRMKTAMMAKGISQKSLVIDLGSTANVISGYINGKNSPSVFKAAKIASILDIPLDELVCLF